MTNHENARHLIAAGIVALGIVALADETPAADAKEPSPIPAPAAHAPHPIPRPTHGIGAPALSRRARGGHATTVAHEPRRPIPLGRYLAAKRGWVGREWVCLYHLWTRESGWRVASYNRSSGATGIPQALPGSKMSTAGPDWRTSARTQIRWGLGYIAARYGSPCAAWSHSNSHGWY